MTCEWIACKDQMPPSDAPVLLHWTLDSEDAYDLGIGMPGEYDNTVEAIREGCVTHWLSIPKPPTK